MFNGLNQYCATTKTVWFRKTDSQIHQRNPCKNKSFILKNIEIEQTYTSEFDTMNSCNNFKTPLIQWLVPP